MAKNDSANTATYQELSAELDQVLGKLQDTDVSVDDAAELYQRGLKLVRALEARIKETENKITKLRAQAE